MLEAEDLYADVALHFQRSSGRILSDIDYDLQMEGTEHLGTLSPRRRMDLCLFYQECLTNIMRHSGATEVRTKLKVNTSKAELTISDNGVGLNQEQTDRIPKSISRRSRLLGSKLSVDSPQQRRHTHPPDSPPSSLSSPALKHCIVCPVYNTFALC